MPTTYTPIDYITAVFNDWPTFGFIGTADSFAADGVLHIAQYGESGDGPNEHVDRYLWRYGLSGADRVKRITTVATSTGKASIGSATAYSSTGAGGAYIECAMHPDDIMTAMQDTMRLIPDPKCVPLGAGHDFDMETTGVDYWGGGAILGSSSASNATPTKVTTDSLVNWGEQSLKVALSGASGYVRGEAVRVVPGAACYLAPDVLVTAGGVIPRVWDLDNGAYIDTANDVTYTGPDWAVMERRFLVPSGCYRIQPQLQGTLISSVFYCDGYFGPYYVGQRQIPRMPTWADESYKTRLIRPAGFKVAISGVTGAKAASSRYWTGDLQRGVDFDIDNIRRAANPNRLSFRDSLGVQETVGKSPLFIQAERAASDIEPMLTPTAPSAQPFDLVLAYFKNQLAMKALALKPDSSVWKSRVAETQITQAQEFVPREAAIAQPVVKRTRTTLVRA